MLRMLFTVNNDDQLRVNDVDIDPDEPVSRLKEAIRVESEPALDHMDANKLILIRIFTKGKGGLTHAELTESSEVFNETSSGQDPEAAKDTVSTCACVKNKKLFFKVMNSLKPVSAYFPSPLKKELYQVLALVPHEKALSQLQAYLGIEPSRPYIPSKRRKLEPATQPTTVNLHTYSDTQILLELDSEYLAESG
ncbi:hypothetical protein BJ741DRAFT_671365 [Chytriomyces cf. hyalinus JEL632]|nr:hypothetical protein BJ741DRAFT_671365 [Chytriomyces cf. hyalinus JEL632]